MVSSQLKFSDGFAKIIETLKWVRDQSGFGNQKILVMTYHYLKISGYFMF